jgi:hypothetical protein
MCQGKDLPGSDLSRRSREHHFERESPPRLTSSTCMDPTGDDGGGIPSSHQTGLPAPPLPDSPRDVRRLAEPQPVLPVDQESTETRSRPRGHATANAPSPVHRVVFPLSRRWWSRTGGSSQDATAMQPSTPQVARFRQSLAPSPLGEVLAAKTPYLHRLCCVRVSLDCLALISLAEVVKTKDDRRGTFHRDRPARPNWDPNLWKNWPRSVGNPCFMGKTATDRNFLTITKGGPRPWVPRQFFRNVRGPRG